MGLSRRSVDLSVARPGEGVRGGPALAEQGIENRDLALVFLLGVFALAGTAALMIVLT